jgi:hypothetical protein
MRVAGVSRQVAQCVAAVAGLATAATIYFWPVVNPSPTHSITSDLATQTYPWRRYATEELFAGRLPHWTPYSGFGFPFLADIETTVLYPVSLLGSLLSGGHLSYRAAEIEDLAHYPIAGLGMFLFLGQTGLGWTAAMVGALTLMFSGFLWAHVGHVTIVQSASWLPWLLLGVARLLKRPTGRAAVGTGVALALSILGGHPPMAWLGGIAAFVVLVFAGLGRSGAGERTHVGRAALGGMLAVLIGVGLTAVQLGPTTILTHASDRWDPTGSFLLDDPLPPENLLTLLMPFAFRHTARDYSLDELHGYLGMLPLLLALWALLRARDRWTGTFAVLSLVGLLMALGVPPFVDALSVGVFRISARGLLVFSVGVAGLAARGAESVWQTSVGRLKASDGRLLRGLWGAVIAAGVVTVWLGRAGVPAPLAAILSRDFVHDWESFTALLAAAVVALSAARCLRGVPWLARAIVVAALLVEALSFPRQMAWSREPPGIRWAASDLAELARVAGPHRAMLPGHTSARNAGIVYRLRVNTVYSSLNLAYLHEFDLVLGHSQGDNVVPLTGTRWVPAGIELRRVPHAADGALFATPDFRATPLSHDMWEVADPPPRAYLPMQVRIMDTRLALRTALQKLWPADAVLVQAPSQCPSRSTPSGGSVVFEADEPDRVVLRVRTAEAGPLVLSDTYYRGWTATIDGQRENILRANLQFRMVCVPAGEHLVVFRFRQPKFHLGLAISLVTVLGAALIARGSKRDRPELGSLTGGL